MDVGSNAHEQAERLSALAVTIDLVADLYRRPLSAEELEYFAALDLDADDYILKNTHCRDGLASMQSFCSAHEDALHVASVSFYKLFVGPHHVLCPPWSTVHVGEKRLFGQMALDVAHEYGAHGFRIPEGTHEPSDHIAYELAYVSELDREIVETLIGDDDGNGDTLVSYCESFVERYMLVWVDVFFGSLRENDSTGFYEGLGILTQGLLEMEGDLLKALE